MKNVGISVTCVIVEFVYSLRYNEMECIVIFMIIKVSVLIPVNGTFSYFSNEKRERGNYLYTRTDFTRAITVYKK